MKTFEEDVYKIFKPYRSASSNFENTVISLLKTNSTNTKLFKHFTMKEKKNQGS